MNNTYQPTTHPNPSTMKINVCFAAAAIFLVDYANANVPLTTQDREMLAFDCNRLQEVSTIRNEAADCELELDFHQEESKSYTVVQKVLTLEIEVRTCHRSSVVQVMECGMHGEE